MSGQHQALHPKKSTEPPGPAAYAPTTLRNGRGFAAGSDGPAWKLLGRSPAAVFISKAHSEIDNVGKNGPGPAGYSPRQSTARGERELLVRLTRTPALALALTLTLALALILTLALALALTLTLTR